MQCLTSACTNAAFGVRTRNKLLAGKAGVRRMIRDAIEKDAEEICSIYNYYIRNSVATFEESEITACSVAERINNINNSGHSWLVATEENKVVGFATRTPML